MLSCDKIMEDLSENKISRCLENFTSENLETCKKLSQHMATILCGAK